MEFRSLVFVAEPLRPATPSPAVRSSLRDGAPPVVTAARSALISLEAGFIKSRRYQRLPRTSVARPDLMRRWAVR